jgi:hypothetical protein
LGGLNIVCPHHLHYYIFQELRMSSFEERVQAKMENIRAQKAAEQEESEIMQEAIRRLKMDEKKGFELRIRAKMEEIRIAREDKKVEMEAMRRLKAKNAELEAMRRLNAERKKKGATVRPITEIHTEWSCPNDDMVHRWRWHGNDYLRNFSNEVWKCNFIENKMTLGDWVGVYDKNTNTILNTPEPEFEDD